MKYTPRLIIFWAVTRYMTNKQVNALMHALGEANIRQDRTFVRIIKEHFNTEIMLKQPLVHQDAMIYHFMNDLQGRFKRKGLIVQYEKEVCLASGIDLWSLSHIKAISSLKE